MTFEDQVRERAYHIWLSGGMAEGLEHEHWAMAEQALKPSEPVVILTKAAAAAKRVKTTTKAAKPAVKASAAKPRARKSVKAEAAAAC